MAGDSMLTLRSAIGGAAPQSRTIALPRAAWLPSLLPLAMALQDRPRVGRKLTLPLVDPNTGVVADVSMEVFAESLFVLQDSAVLDPRTRRWRGVLGDTVRAWRIGAAAGADSTIAFAGWIDVHGRVVATRRDGLQLQYRPYEEAFENWRLDAEARGAAPPPEIEAMLKRSAGTSGGRGRNR
jgi:hypothetical protein